VGWSEYIMTCTRGGFIRKDISDRLCFNSLRLGTKLGPTA
jgi:hypothetical protein